MSRPRTVYRGKRKYGWLITLVLFIVVFAVIFAVWLFYYLQKFIVYDKDGLSLVLPYMSSDTAEPGGEEDVDSPAVTSPPVSAEIVIATPDFSDVTSTAGEGISDIKAVYVPADSVSASYLLGYKTVMQSNSSNALVIQLKKTDGNLSYHSGVDLADSYGVNGTEDISEAVEALKEQGIYLVADISCLLDTNMAVRNIPLALKNADTGAVFTNSSGAWLDPYNREARQYITDIITELAEMGFDEVLISGMTCPVTENISFSQDMTGTPDAASGVSAFAIFISEEARNIGIKVSVMCDSYKLRSGESNVIGQDIDLFFRIFDRVYFETDSGNYFTDLTALQGYLGETDSSRTVPVTTAFTPTAESYAVK